MGGATIGSIVGGIAGAVIGFFAGGNVYLGWAIGSALGGLAGGLIDAPKTNIPRLNDVKIRGADYGQMRLIPYGKIRVGGLGNGQGSVENGPNKFTVISGNSGGKGGGGTPTADSYALSFYNEICEGPIIGVLRRWVNGRLVTENEEPPSDKWPYTLYLGDTTQLPDPTMETIYGVGDVSPMRGVAGEMVTELRLNDYGQSRPNVEYEVFTAGGDIPWRVATFDLWPQGSAPGIGQGSKAATYNSDTGIITTSFAQRIGGVTDFFVNQFYLDGTVAHGEVVSSVHDALGSFSSAVNSEFRNAHIVTVLGPGPADLGAWTLDEDPTSSTFLQFVGGGAHAPPLSLFFPTRLRGNWNVVMNGATYGADDESGVTYVTGPGGSYMLDAHYVASAVGLGISDTGHLYVMVELVGATKLWKLDVAAMTLVHFWDVADTAGTGLTQFAHTNFHVYNNLICYQYDAGVPQFLALVRINGDDTLEDYGVQISTTGVARNVTLGDPYTATGLNGPLGFDEVGIYSLAPPPSRVILGDIVADIMRRDGYADSEFDVSDLTQLVRGFVIGSQMTGFNAIQTLRQGFFFDAAPMNGKTVYRNRGHDASETIPDADLCAHEPGTEKPEPLAVSRVPELELPRRIWINYYNVDNDYQEGSQPWTREVTLSQAEVTLNLPIAFTAGEALQVAGWHMHFAWLERERFVFFLPDKYLRLRPTDVVVVRGVNIRITSATEMPSGVIRFEGVRAFAGAFSISDPVDGSVPGSGGGGQPPQDPPGVKATTGLILIDGPLTSESDSITGIRAAVYRANTGPWTGAGVYKSVDGGTTYASVASTTTSATVGVVATAVGTFAGGNVVDESNILRVTLHDSTSTLSSTTADGLSNGLNLFAYGSTTGGWEMMQYRTATLISAGVYDLSGLMRYRFGTEWVTHSANDLFVLWDGTIVLPGALAEIGVSRKYKPVTNGTAIADATAIDFTNTGVAGKALSPVLVGGGRDASGNLTVTWVPRRRGTGGWPNGTDLPATDFAIWQIEIATTSGYTAYARLTGVSITTYTYTAAEQTIDFGSPQATVYLRVAQFAAVGGLGYFTRATL